MKQNSSIRQGEAGVASSLKAPFPCSRCGACCANLELFGVTYAWLVDKKTGACRYYDRESRLCSIYPVRPLVCNLRLGHLLYFSNMDWSEFVRKNLEACELLRALAP